jgi:hypothetical protein
VFFLHADYVSRDLASRSLLRLGVWGFCCFGDSDACLRCSSVAMPEAEDRPVNGRVSESSKAELKKYMTSSVRRRSLLRTNYGSSLSLCLSLRKVEWELKIMVREGEGEGQGEKTNTSIYGFFVSCVCYGSVGL